MNPQNESEKTTGFGTGYSSGDITKAFSDAVQNAIAESRRKGYPVARYDAARRQAYLESAEGAREYVNGPK